MAEGVREMRKTKIVCTLGVKEANTHFLGYKTKLIGTRNLVICQHSYEIGRAHV